jgi:hypothetical protein
MSAIYQADIYCDDCGEALAAELLAARKFPSYWSGSERAAVRDEAGDARAAGVVFDSDDWPSLGHPGEDTDCPQHCGAGAECINAEELSDGSRVGMLLDGGLTVEGGEYVREAIEEAEARRVDAAEALARAAEQLLGSVGGAAPFVRQLREALAEYRSGSVALELWRPAFSDYL